MLTHSMNRLRDEPVTAWTTIVGLLSIVALLWAFGAFVQGHVERAHARLEQPAQMQGVATRCGPGAPSTCDALQTVSTDTGMQSAVSKPVSVVYH